jgi:hypothetical protein
MRGYSSGFTKSYGILQIRLRNTAHAVEKKEKINIKKLKAARLKAVNLYLHYET